MATTTKSSQQKSSGAIAFSDDSACYSNEQTGGDLKQIIA